MGRRTAALYAGSVVVLTAILGLRGLTLPAVVRGTMNRLGGSVWWSLSAVIVALIASRMAVVGVTSSLVAVGAHPLPRGWRWVLVWSGLRGAVSLAAALSLPDDLRARPCPGADLWRDPVHPARPGCHHARPGRPSAPGTAQGRTVRVLIAGVLIVARLHRQLQARYYLPQPGMLCL